MTTLPADSSDKKPGYPFPYGIVTGIAGDKEGKNQGFCNKTSDLK
jgi:hypothetical protein